MNYNKLQREVATWVEAQIISLAQGNKILARYDDHVPAYKKMSFWLQCLAATLAGFALLLVISKNWQHLHWFAQSAITFVPLLLAQFWAVWQERRDNHLGAEIGWFLASIALGANIMIQAQIFHISAYYPNGVLFWVIGILPVLIFRGSMVNFLLASILFVMYLGMQISHHQFSPLSILPLAVFAWFAWSSQRVLTLVPLLLTVYLFLQTILLHWQTLHSGVTWELAMLIFAVALVQQFTKIAEDWSGRLIYLIFAFTAFLNILFTFTFFARSATNSADSVASILLGVLALGSIVLGRASLRERQVTWLILTNIVLTVASLWINRLVLPDADQGSYNVVRIAANVIYLGSIAALLFRAIAIREKSLFMGAVMAFLLWTLIRYFDLFANYLITALIFGVSAVVLVLLNRLWEKKYEN